MLSEREKGFLRRVVGKYGKDDAAILRKSVIVITILIVAAHAVERSGLPGWIAFLVVYVPSIIMYTQFRRFEIFKTRILVNLAREVDLGPAPGPAAGVRES